VLAIAVAAPCAAVASANAQKPEERLAVSDFIHAARWGDTEALKTALARGMDVNAHDIDGVTAIRWAAVEGQTAVVQLLIEAGADVDSSDSHSVTGLMMAARWGFTDIVAALLDAGAEVDMISTLGAGRTALMYAAIRGHDEIATLLLAAEADPSIEDGQGFTAAELAKRWGRPHMARLISEHGGTASQ